MANKRKKWQKPKLYDSWFTIINAAMIQIFTRDKHAGTLLHTPVGNEELAHGNTAVERFLYRGDNNDRTLGRVKSCPGPRFTGQITRHPAPPPV
ncbi:hypothetical protein WN51_09388 [Melipona quadrifasciata]|uniref:Uncharacterized protein n=1 Tax=Melipona quadrifasciata TaxID=166423 RepID=A0A0M9A7W7_9HYME|nr:hypothetical protein WN51_09388 [Melipona quadrifasciata]